MCWIEKQRVRERNERTTIQRVKNIPKQRKIVCVWDGTEQFVRLNWGHQFKSNCCTHANSLDSIESNDKRTQINFAYKTAVFFTDYAHSYIHLTRAHQCTWVQPSQQYTNTYKHTYTSTNTRDSPTTLEIHHTCIVCIVENDYMFLNILFWMNFQWNL